MLASIRSPLQSMWDLTIPPLGDLVCSLTLVPLSNRCGISQSTPFGAQRPRWRTTWCLALISFVTAQAHRQILSSLGFPFRASPQGFKTRLLGRGFHTLYKEYFVSLSNRFGISQSHLPSGPSVLVGTPHGVWL